MRYEYGIGLAEVMISLLLSSIILLTLLQHYSVIKKQYRHVQSELTEDLDIMLLSQLLRSSIHQAGFTPCFTLPHLTTADRRHENLPLTNFTVDSGQSSLSTYRMSEHFAIVKSIVDDNTIITDLSVIFHHSGSIIIADCYHAEVQQIARAHQDGNQQNITLEKPLLFNYQSPIYVGRWLEESYFVQNTSLGQKALMYRTQHSEVLTMLIQSLYVQWIKSTCPRIHLQLGLKNRDDIILESRVRAC